MKTKYMKLFLGLFVMLAMTSLTLTSCSDDKDDNDLIGTWYLLEEDDEEKIEVWATFTADGAFSTKMVYTDKETKETETESYKGTYKVDGNKITVTGNGETKTGTYSIKGNKLTMTWTDDEDGDTYTEVWTRK